MTEEPPMRAGADPADPLPPTPIALPEEITHPNITEQLLNAQLAECLLILRDAAHLYRNSPFEPHERGHYVTQPVELMKASAEVAAMVSRLKNGDARPEIRQRFTVERITRAALPGEGEGQISEND